MEYEGKVMISELQSYFKFEQLSGNEESLNRWVIVPDVNRPGLELAGFYKHTEPRRIVIIGDKEQAYIDTLSVEIQHSLKQLRSESIAPKEQGGRQHGQYDQPWLYRSAVLPPENGRHRPAQQYRPDHGQEYRHAGCRHLRFHFRHRECCRRRFYKG